MLLMLHLITFADGNTGHIPAQLIVSLHYNHAQAYSDESFTNFSAIYFQVIM